MEWTHRKFVFVCKQTRRTEKDNHVARFFDSDQRNPFKKNLREKIYSLTKRFSPDQNVEVTKKNRWDEWSQLIIIITDRTKFFAHALYSIHLWRTGTYKYVYVYKQAHFMQSNKSKSEINIYTGMHKMTNVFPSLLFSHTFFFRSMRRHNHKCFFLPCSCGCNAQGKNTAMQNIPRQIHQIDTKQADK